MKIRDSYKIETVYEGEEINHDIYIIEEKTPLSTKEITIVVDHIKEEIIGEMIAYGGFSKLDSEEYLRYVLEIDDPIRDFNYILNKEK